MSAHRSALSAAVSEQLARAEHEGVVVVAAGTYATPVGTADAWTGGEAAGPAGRRK